MYNKKYAIVLAALASSMLSATAYEWGSGDGTGAWNGSTSGGLVSQDNVALDSEVRTIESGDVTQYGLFLPQAGDTLTLSGTTTIQGDVEIRFTGSLPATDHEFFEINIGTEDDHDDPVYLNAFTDGTTTTAGYSQLIINTAQGKTTVVNVYSDFYVQSADALGGYDPEDPDSGGAPIPFIFTIRGQGSCVFRMPSGRRVYFGPPTPGNVEEGEFAATPNLSQVGTSVRIYMEQLKLDVYGGAVDGGYILPRSQLVFEKWSYNADVVNDDLTQDTWVTFGQLSSFVFISDNYQGVSESWVDVNGNNDQDLGETAHKPGYGSIAFDVSSAGAGRMILELARGQLPSGNDFTDAGFNLYGALLVPSRQATDRRTATILNQDFRNGIYFNQRAGIRALMRVTSDVEFYERALDDASWISRPADERRGLVVINHNNTIPHFASNYDQASRIDTSRWAQFNDYEPGFIVGVNGGIEVKPHLFFDYYANNTNKAITNAHADTTTTHTATRAKKHNPAALYMDGLPSYDARSKRTNDQFGVPISNLLYVGHHSEFGTRPIVQLEGNAQLLLRACAPDDGVSMIKPLFEQPYHAGHYHLLKTSETTVASCLLGIGTYDGTFVSVRDQFENLTMQTTEPEGSHALDVEGNAAIYSIPGPLGEAASGVFKVPSIEIDHTGREVGYDNFLVWLAWQSWLATTEDFAPTTVTLADGSTQLFTDATFITQTQSVIDSRPLEKEFRYYGVHDVSSIFLNASLELDGVTWQHDDVTRNLSVLPTPFKEARPHVVGAELASITGALAPPSLKLFNSTLALHESLVMTGVALTVHEVPSGNLDWTHNTSRIVSYNRGKEYDNRGNGRILQFGSQGNSAADGLSTSLLLSSATCDVYRAAPTEGATAEEPTTIQLSYAASQEPAVSPSETSLHMLYLANGSQIRLGWPTLEGDSGYTPATMDNIILEQLQADDPSNKNGYRFSSYETGIGHLLFEGGPYAIGAGDFVDDLPPEWPVIGRDVDGVVYVDHGGKLSITNTADLHYSTIIAFRTAADPAACGIVRLPIDQAYRVMDGIIQDYSTDFALDQSVTGPKAHHVELSINHSSHLFDVQLMYETSDIEPLK